MSTSPPSAPRTRIAAPAFLELISAMDDAFVEESKWADARAKLIGVLPMLSTDIPLRFPSEDELIQLKRRGSDYHWTKEDKEVLAFVCSRLERASELRRGFEAAHVRSRAAMRALDYVPRGALILDRVARVLIVNRTAQTILAQRDGLQAHQGYLKASSAECDAQIRDAIDTIITRNSPALTLPVRRCQGQVLTLIFTSPIDSVSSDQPEGSVMVLINEPERKVSLDPGLLCCAYGLTRSEANLACRMAAGEELSRAAEVLGITSNTARTHLKRIFMKTDTNRQPQLVLLLAGHANAPHPSRPERRARAFLA